MSDLKMLTMDDVKQGLKYIHIGMTLSGDIFLDLGLIQKTIFPGERLDYDKYENLLHWHDSDERFVESSYYSSQGFTQGIGAFADNYHRVFEYSESNLDYLNSLVKRQDVESYFNLIEVTINIEEFRLSAKQRCEELFMADDREDALGNHIDFLESLKVNPEFKMPKHSSQG